jgi:hypothetical protein
LATAKMWMISRWPFWAEMYMGLELFLVVHWFTSALWLIRVTTMGACAFSQAVYSGVAPVVLRTCC